MQLSPQDSLQPGALWPFNNGPGPSHRQSLPSIPPSRVIGTAVSTVTNSWDGLTTRERVLHEHATQKAVPAHAEEPEPRVTSSEVASVIQHGQRVLEKLRSHAVTPSRRVTRVLDYPPDFDPEDVDYVSASAREVALAVAPLSGRVYDLAPASPADPVAPEDRASDAGSARTSARYVAGRPLPSSSRWCAYVCLLALLPHDF